MFERMSTEELPENVMITWQFLFLTVELTSSTLLSIGLSSHDTSMNI